MVWLDRLDISKRMCIKRKLQLTIIFFYTSHENTFNEIWNHTRKDNGHYTEMHLNWGNFNL